MFVVQKTWLSCADHTRFWLRVWRCEALDCSVAVCWIREIDLSIYVGYIVGVCSVQLFVRRCFQHPLGSVRVARSSPHPNHHQKIAPTSKKLATVFFLHRCQKMVGLKELSHASWEDAKVSAAQNIFSDLMITKYSKVVWAKNSRSLIVV